jgi:hypothetical protein
MNNILIKAALYYKSKQMKKDINYLILHGVNGEGYSDPTIKRVQTIYMVLAYISSVFGDKAPEIENNQMWNIAKKKGFSLYITDKEENTERITVFEVCEKDIALVSIDANVTEFDVHTFSDKKLAIEALDDFAKIITEPDEEENSLTCIAGEGVDGYYHFEIV